ncbi:MAG: SpoIIE family protein phosphatase, partial [Propionibacteriaceae bacterium]
MISAPGLSAAASDTLASFGLGELVLGQSPIGVAVFDVHATYVQANPAMERMLARPTAQLAGHTIAEIVNGSLGSDADALVRLVLQTGQPQLSRELAGHLPGDDTARSFLVSYFPLIDAGHVRGAAALVSDITDRNQTRRGVERSHDRLRLLGLASEVLSGSLVLSQTLERLTELAVPAFADHLVIDLLEAGTSGLRRALLAHAEGRTLTGAAWAGAGSEISYPALHPAAQALISGRGSLLLADDDRNGPHRLFGPESAIGAALTVPLRARGHAVGVASFAVSAPGRRYTDDDLILARQLADRAAIAIDNARLFGEQQSTALTLQRSLLPDLPHAPGVDAAARYLPASGGPVGGDWYDLIQLSPSRVAIVIGDVMGRGVPAAALMGQVRTAVRAYAVQDLQPADVLANLDEIVRGLDDTSIVTCVYAVYDMLDGELCMASAGHVPPLLLGADDVVDVPAMGPPLGAGGGEPYEQMRTPFDHRRALLMYTDGLVETRSEAVDLGIARLVRALQPLPGDADAVCETAVTVLGDVRRSDDDVALLVVRPLPAAVRASAPVVLGTDPREAGRARRVAAQTLTELGVQDAELLDRAVLAVSELVTNALTYARSACRLRLARLPGEELLIEVSDDDGSLPHRQRAALDSEHGRGLALVDALAVHWGA